MASLRTAVRLVARAQFARQRPTSRVAARFIPCRYASGSQYPHEDDPAVLNATPRNIDPATVDVDKVVKEQAATQLDMDAFLPYPEEEDEHVSEPEPDPAELGEDPHMNGNWPNPTDTAALPVKRQHRDPYGDWWDPIEKRNYGEPVHEDNDILGVFSPDDYTHFTSAWGGVLMGTFVATFLGLCAVVYQYYPDQPSVTRTFEGGLEKELGGPLARPARASVDEPAPLDRSVV